MKNTPLSCCRTLAVLLYALSSIRHPLFVILYALSVILYPLSTLHAAVPLRWSVETSRLQPVAFDAVRGETLALEAAFNSYGTALQLPTNAVYALFYQTNGMASAWWQIPAAVSSNRLAAVFAPTNDPGAPVVRAFLGSTGEIFRAAFTLRFRDGPGAVPNALPLPAQTIDCAKVTFLNPDAAPFSGGGSGCDTNAVKALIAPATNAVYIAATNATLAAAKTYAESVTNIAEAVVTPATNTVTSVLMAELSSASTASTNYTDAVKADYRNKTNLVVYTTRKVLGDDFLPLKYGDTDITSTYYLSLVGSWYQIMVDDVSYGEINALDSTYGNGYPNLTFNGSSLSHGAPITLVDEYVPTTDTLVTSNLANRVYATKATETTVAAWENYWTGDKVRLSVTNYYGNTSGELPRLRIEEAYTVTNADSSVSNLFRVVWDEESRHTNYQATVDAKVVTISNTVMTAAYRQTYNQLAAKAPRAWQDVTSAGEAAPEDTVWHTAPNTVFAGGTEYAHVAVGEGVICVLTDNGAPVYTEGEEGKFRFTDDSGEYYFGFDVSTGYTLGCRTDGISVDPSTQLVTLTYDLTSSDNPTIMTCTNLLTGTWSTASVTWDQNPPTGTKVCYIDCGSNPQGFYKAVITHAVGAKFITNMQADLAGGIAASNLTLNVVQEVYPVITNGVVVWRVKQ